MNNRTFLEKPIDNEKDDLFNIISYVNDLEKAIDDGAKFIAIDGEYGSGKSSLVNLLELREKSKDKKSTFVNVNFLNVNEKEDGLDDIESRINIYHRYFVNQVANDLCCNPFEIEQLFYRSFISYSVTNPSKYKIWSKIVDKLLLMLLSYMIVYLSYKVFLESVDELKFVFKYANIINAVVLIIIFVLVIMYGYGIYKPDKQEQSPMLDVDKCRNNFLKVINTNLKRHFSLGRQDKKVNLFIIIDDLDRIDEELQIKIISLLFNEYYPLKIEGVNLVFVFMINVHKIEGNLFDNKLSSEKLFDYILSVSNNQKHIIRHLTKDMIDDHVILSEIFNNDSIKNREYLINIICKRFTSIRSIKHFFNKLISKYNYIKNKGIEDINYDELVVISILLDDFETSVLDEAIANIINNEQLDDSVKSVEVLLKECYSKKIFDKDYYVYLYNFINKNDMFNYYENEIYSISEKGYENISVEEKMKIISYLENNKVRYDKTFYEIFEFLDNDTKLIFAASKNFCNYLVKSSNFFENIDIKDAYKNDFGYFLCDNIILTESNKYEFIMSLEQSKNLYISLKNDINYQSFENNFIQFLIKMNSRILNFNLNDYFSLIKINDKIYNILFEQVIFNNMNIGFYLLYVGIINCSYLKEYIDVPFIERVNTLPLEVKNEIKEQILFTDGISFDVLVNIICDSNIKYENIDEIYNKINQFDICISYDKLIIILNNYGYNKKLDKHIIKNLDDNQEKMINIINDNQYLISEDILNKLKTIPVCYHFNTFYENVFIENGYYSLYIYSKIIGSHKFTLNKRLISNLEYEAELLESYENIYPWASQFDFTKEYTLFILEKFDFNKLNFTNDNFWKITNLIPNVDDFEIFESILGILNTQNQFDNFCDYCIKNNIGIKFIKYLRLYAEKFGMSRTVKAKLTKCINKLRLPMI